MHQAVALNILRQLHNILLGICLPEDFVVRVYANIVQCNIPSFVFNAFMPCGQITDNFSCIAIIGINFAKLCIRRAGTFYDFLLLAGLFIPISFHLQTLFQLFVGFHIGFCHRLRFCHIAHRQKREMDVFTVLLVGIATLNSDVPSSSLKCS